MPIKFLLLGGGFLVFPEGGGGGSANFIFMGVGIFRLEGPTRKPRHATAFLALALRQASGSRIPLYTNV